MPPIGGTVEDEVQIIVAAMRPTVAIGSLGSRVCQAIVGIQVFAVDDLGVPRLRPSPARRFRPETL